MAEIAAERGVDGVDALLDLTLEDDLENEFTVQSWNTRVDRMSELLNDKSVLLGLGDGGAHLDMLCDSGYPTYVLGTWVRERKVLTLEEAVRRMTSDPADFYGIKDRGRIAPGMAADIVIFDPATVGSGGRAGAAARSAGRRQAHGEALARRRDDAGERRGDLGERRADRRRGGTRPAFLITAREGLNKSSPPSRDDFVSSRTRSIPASRRRAG